MIVLVTGGARSGKSSFAESWCIKHSDSGSGLYIATAQAFDEEMKERIQHHRGQREGSGFKWTTLEEPLRLPELLSTLVQAGSSSSVVLVDCLTLWLSNVLLSDEEENGSGEESRTESSIRRLVEAVSAYSGQLVLVTNEVGSGIVPEFRLGRQYRDLAGRLNQSIAAIADQVFLVTAGIPIELKGREYRL
ncbi:bifunctional adenosylcobinamide kinase/adenosylcobinamide-phosphate guanylyltransferase [Paenibacillus apis]|uniref:Adenosylcobinamide kinase n=1 Tax=Paenibacillus apis TaxID=1792174 RepID=A0A919Y5K9_9BACL|nr:bifunctional adenosylcobinamide kinase/adenosylcobinamide-phosphate guanylyltransferase [Paenibacillus apis]GIO45062.1 adenosylcobinamide kinase/adenosylcobinamide phosphate guanyltransferase [Paenibacillus apis]